MIFMKKKIGNIFLYIPAFLLSVITVYPILWVFCAAVSRTSQMGRISVIPEGVTLQRIFLLFTKYGFGQYFLNSFIYAIISCLVSLLFNSMAAYSFAKLRFPGKDKIFAVYLATMMVPFSIIMMPLYIMMTKLDLNNSLAALILPSMAGAYGVFLLRQFYMGIPKELEDAGRIDGLGYWGSYTHIIIPLSKPIMLTLGIFSFKGSWNNYLWPIIVNDRSEYFVISQGLSKFSTHLSTDWNSVLAGSAVSMLPIIFIFIFFQKYLVEGIKMSGLKG